MFAQLCAARRKRSSVLQRGYLAADNADLRARAGSRCSARAVDSECKPDAALLSDSRTVSAG